MSGGRLDGRRVLVTGAASGIGRATAQRLAADGARVALLDVRPAGEAGDARMSRSWVCDVADAETLPPVVAEAADWLGGLDAVVHVAAVVRGYDVQVDALDRDDWDAVMGVNLTGAYLVARHTVPHLERTGGVLVLTGSGAGVHNAHDSIPYAASKGGLHGLAITLEESLRPRGIRVNDVLPGSVDTPLVRAHSGDDSVEERLRSGRTIPAERVAAVMAFLVSEDAAAVRGTVRTW